MTKLARYRVQIAYTMYSEGVRHEITYQTRNAEGLQNNIKGYDQDIKEFIGVLVGTKPDEKKLKAIAAISD